MVALAIGVLIGAISVAGAIRVRSGTNQITVTGSARRSVSSDQVAWDGSVSSTQTSTADALRELTGWSDQVRNGLRAAGAHDDEISVEPVSAQPKPETTANGTDTGRVVGYTLTRNFHIRSSRVPDIAKVVADAGNSLLAAGVPLTASPPRYLYTQLPQVRPDLLAEATRDARSRAAALVKVSGGRIGRPRDIKAGVFQVTAPNATDVSDSGIYDTSTPEKDVTAVVSVTFSLS